MSYSSDFRQKVIDAIEINGYKKTEASEMFNVSRNTINLWLKRKRETGDFQPLPTIPKTDGNKIKDWQLFKDFVQLNGDKTQEEMASLWGEEISRSSIARGLKKIGFTRKKKLLAIKKEMKLNVKNLSRN